MEIEIQQDQLVIQFSKEEWERIQIRAGQRGFADVRSYILFLIERDDPDDQS